jgi:hypothetical protein
MICSSAIEINGAKIAEDLFATKPFQGEIRD